MRSRKHCAGKPPVPFGLVHFVNMYRVILETDDEFIRPGRQDLFESRRLTAVDQPKVIDKLIEWWTRTKRQIQHAKLGSEKQNNFRGCIIG
jgi:hypothetical protein